MTKYMKNNKDKGAPIPGVQYALTGKKGDKCIMNGNTWDESKVIPVAVAQALALEKDSANSPEDMAKFCSAVANLSVAERGLLKTLIINQ